MLHFAALSCLVLWTSAYREGFATRRPPGPGFRCEVQQSFPTPRPSFQALCSLASDILCWESCCCAGQWSSDSWASTCGHALQAIDAHLDFALHVKRISGSVPQVYCFFISYVSSTDAMALRSGAVGFALTTFPYRSSRATQHGTYSTTRSSCLPSLPTGSTLELLLCTKTTCTLTKTHALYDAIWTPLLPHYFTMSPPKPLPRWCRWPWWSREARHFHKF